MRVVPDPNVLLSAIIAPGGTSDQAVRAATTHGRLVVSRQLVDRFLARAADPKFRRWFTVDDAHVLAERLLDAAAVVSDPSDVPPVVEGDPSDDYLVALARENDAVLLTGDRGIHRSLANVGHPVVLDPAGLLSHVEAETESGAPGDGS